MRITRPWPTTSGPWYLPISAGSHFERLQRWPSKPRAGEQRFSIPAGPRGLTDSSTAGSGRQRVVGVLHRCGRRCHGTCRGPSRMGTDRIPAGYGVQSGLCRLAAWNYRADRWSAHPCRSGTCHLCCSCWRVDPPTGAHSAVRPFAVELASTAHETQYTRLFRS